MYLAPLLATFILHEDSMKWVSKFCVLALLPVCLSAQQEPSSLMCSADILWHQLCISHPEYVAKAKRQEEKYRGYTSTGIKPRGNNTIILPVVVHIIHDNGTENIPDARVHQMLDWISDAFRNRNAFYNPDGVDLGIELCLAQRDTNGIATSGIVRHQSVFTEMSNPQSQSQITALATWDTHKYINIRLVRAVCLGGSCLTAGYATYPAAHGSAHDGIVMEAEYAGSSKKNAVVLIHEIGHYLGLLHTFQGGCPNQDCLVDGDHVCDTPPDNMMGPFPCDVDYNTCYTDQNDNSVNNPFRSIALGGLGEQNDMIQNYMDYSAYSCYDRFTPGQSSRMHYYLEEVRSSLLTSKACLPPCTDEPLAFFTPDVDTIDAGGFIQVNNLSQKASFYTWYINDILTGHAVDTVFRFDIAGEYILKLVAESPYLECSTVSYEHLIVVVCPVKASYSYYLDGDWLYLTDLSLLADDIVWTVRDGAGMVLFTSSLPIDSIELTGQEYIQLCMTVSNPYCADLHCEYIRLIEDGIEICNNQVDDDNDGLTDLFDPDCPCTDTSYQAVCDRPCNYIPDSFPLFSMKLKWQSEIYATSRAYVSPNLVVGNIDTDSNIEVVTKKSIGNWLLDNVENNIIVLNGNDGSINKEFVSNLNRSFYDDYFVTIADIDRNGLAEFITKSWDTLICFNTDGSIRWKSDLLNMGRGLLVNIADFNGDGIPETYSGNNIVNAQTGDLLMNSSFGAGCNILSGTLLENCGFNHSIAADLLPAAGLELAAGNTVYQIEINNLNGTTGNNMIPVFADSPVLDGLTSVGDMDGDGELDVVVIRDTSYPDGGGIWVWNPRTKALIASAQAGRTGGVPFIGDVDGDCSPEIGMTFRKELRMYKYDGSPNLQLLYNLPTTDQSGITGITMFDFNQDGKNELVYRDETDLRIIEGSTGYTMASYPIQSGTGMEYPVIADVDNDGQAEILVNGYLIDETEQRVFCFESASAPWAPARSVWNQPGYHVTNVNDDLTIPRYPQHQAKALTGYENCPQPTCPTPYNAFMTQATYRTQEGCVQFPAADVALEILGYECQIDSFSICLVIHNLGNEPLINQPMEVSCWPSNPFVWDPQVLATSRDTLNLNPGQSDTFCIADPVFPWQDSLFIVVNDPGTTETPYAFPISDLVECNYKNNIGSFFLDLAPRTLDLGPDIVKCASQVVTFYAGSGFTQYLWNDGSIDSIYSSGFPGFHFVEAVDHCGRIYRDTIIITIDAADNVDLGVDVELCPGQEMQYTVSGDYDWLQWLPGSVVDCDTCSTIIVSSDSSCVLIATAGKGTCVYTDSVDILIKQPIEIDSSILVCKGDTLEYRDSLLFEAGIYEFENPSCDTLYKINLAVNLPDTTLMDQMICANDSLWFDGIWIKQEGVYSITSTNVRGCDSTIILFLHVKTEIFKHESISICDGDSTQVFEQWVYEDIVLNHTYQTPEGCDSTIQVEVLFTPFQNEFDTLTICQGDSVRINNVWISSPGIYSDTLDALPCRLIKSTLVEFIPISASNSDFVLCPNDSVWVDGAWINEPLDSQLIFTGHLGCDSIENISVRIVPRPDPPISDIDCVLGAIHLSVSADSQWHIIWDNGDTTSQTLYYSGNSVNVMLFANPACSITFNINIPSIPDILSIPELQDLHVKSGDPLYFNIDLDSTLWKIKWSPTNLFVCPDCFNTVMLPDGNTTIEITLIHESGCIYVDSLHVFVENQNPLFYIPNVFSPNGDGVNDLWILYVDPAYGKIERLEIFDRWGTLLQSWEQVTQAVWDGTFNGHSLNASVFTYRLSYRTVDAGIQVWRGDITLLK